AAAEQRSDLSPWPTPIGMPAASSVAQSRDTKSSANWRHLTNQLEETSMLTTRSLNSTLDRMMSLNRVLDQAINGSLPTESTSRVWVPALDIVEKRDAYVVVAELPGVSQNDVELSFEQNEI